MPYIVLSLSQEIKNKEKYIKELEKEIKVLNKELKKVQEERDMYFNNMQDLIVENDSMFYQLSHLDKFYKPTPKVKKIKVKKIKVKKYVESSPTEYRPPRCPKCCSDSVVLTEYNSDSITYECLNCTVKIVEKKHNCLIKTEE
jgi:hypothetical protein